MATAQSLNAIGTRVCDLWLLNRRPILYSSYTLKTATDAILIVPAGATLPETQARPQSSPEFTSLAGNRIVTDIFQGANRGILSFAHTHATEADGTSTTGIAFGINRLRAVDAAPNPVPGVDTADYHERVEIPLFSFTLTGGANAISLTTSRIIEPPAGVLSMKWCDTISAVTSYTRSTPIVHNDGANSMSMIDFDTEGYEWIAIELKPGSGVGVFAFGKTL